MSERAQQERVWLTVIGIGDDGPAGLGASTLALINSADVLVGGKRLQAMFPDFAGERLSWRTPMRDSLAEIDRYRGRRVVALATGDPMCFGVGETLALGFSADDMRVIPAPSAFALACARMGWSRNDVETISLHGRAPHRLHRHMQPGARIVLLSHDGQTPRVVAEMLNERGFGPSRMSVFEHMGGTEERRIDGVAETWPAREVKPFNTVAVEVIGGPTAQVFPTVPGMADDAFRHDGMLTKREIRAVTLARLMPMSGQLLWDVGAGSGSVAIEWLRSARAMRACAIERDPARCALIAGNADQLGTPELRVVFGQAPDVLGDLEDPDAVFIGGGSHDRALFETCWQRLRPGGRLVANAVTLESERTLADFRQACAGALCRISIARSTPVGSYLGWRPLMPVTQLAATKP
ncbi:MAG: precorrin-6y C5,15-methyltransferase (decarboxylating) subunit CbiE [Geminicoccaceae bacterium]